MLMNFPFSWVLQTAQAIEGSTTFAQALKVTVANLSDLLDALIPIVEPGSMLEGQYPAFCELKLKEWQQWGTPVDHEPIDHLYFLASARDIFHLYENQTSMAEWELEHEAASLFVPEFDLNVEKEDAMRIIFAHVCTYFQGWLESEIKNPTPRALKQLTFESCAFYGSPALPNDWHLSPEEEQAPDGLEEFERVGWE